MQEYQALARKYRPHTLLDLVGQDVLVNTIKNAILQDRIHHAFLFTGTRGVGKTTTARIIALSLNCTGENGEIIKPTITPCLKCSNCQQILAGNHPDVIEFDAASKTGIDSMREIIDSCIYPPIIARYKVYIIDEVHMLSKAAFNALLKTLEEPARNIKFIFATTEIKKVPVTITSRCQKFVLRNFDTPTLADYLIKVAIQEGCKIDNESATLLAEMATGSARDGLSLLDQAISSSEDKIITIKKVMTMLSVSDTKLICNLFKSIILQDFTAINDIVSEIKSSVVDLPSIITDLLQIIAFAVKYLLYKEANKDINTFVLQTIQELEKDINLQVLLRMWQIGLTGIDDLKVINNITTLDIMIAKMIFSVRLPLPSEILQKLQAEALETAETLFENKS